MRSPRISVRKVLAVLAQVEAQAAKAVEEYTALTELAQSPEAKQTYRELAEFYHGKERAATTFRLALDDATPIRVYLEQSKLGS